MWRSRSRQGQHRLPRYPTAPMTDALNWLRLGLSGMALVFLTVTGRAIAGQAGQCLPSARQTGVGLFTNFFDTPGIGSFAPTTALFRLMRMVVARGGAPVPPPGFPRVQICS